ncbi:hypothetical protein B0J12DRAFT_740967 [Macrophomina phaseolina]|uniref:Uncharacterized protein n=1 Tax=Macrophomina phaseolina TaxID=35725 RepID=A0ABQ8G8C3_9PEZI|nr:hypothetical protein B0J12DRAFT_740967 [Macrophomina phaseolina]
MATKTECGCALVALRALARLEQLEGTAVSLGMSLEVAERAEADCLTVLHCERCRQRRFALISATALSASVVDWLQRSWQLDSSVPERLPAHISLGDYQLEAADAEALSRELMALRLSYLSKVMGSLKAAITTLGAAQAEICLDVVHAKLQQLRDCTQAVKARLAAAE